MTENLSYSDYIIWERRQSVIDPDKTLRIEVGMKCPRCKQEMKPMEHFEIRRCMECGLRMTLHGNQLECRA